jgi:hypothetical protein
VPKLSTKGRYFEQVAADLKQAGYAVVRHRPVAGGRPGETQAFPLGSGFFVSPTLFLTCHHVINAVNSPHLNGDKYTLVQNLGAGIGVFSVNNVVIGNQLQLFPQVDLALLNVAARPNQPYVALDFGAVREGTEIGVAGYPLPNLSVINNQLNYQGLIYRVAKGVVTASYTSILNSPELPGPVTAAIIEVNFLFVSGNSGGPIFKASNGAVVGFVHGFISPKIKEEVQQVTLIRPAALPTGIPNPYVASVHAVYSLGIKLDSVRVHLAQAGLSV